MNSLHPTNFPGAIIMKCKCALNACKTSLTQRSLSSSTYVERFHLGCHLGYCKILSSTSLLIKIKGSSKKQKSSLKKMEIVRFFKPAPVFFFLSDAGALIMQEEGNSVVYLTYHKMQAMPCRSSSVELVTNLTIKVSD